MDYGALAYFVLLLCATNALPYEDDSHEVSDITVVIEDNHHHILRDEEPQKPSELEKRIITDKPKPAKYEVTEFVIDVPDDRTRGPIVTNFSITKPINVITPVVVPENNDKDKNTNEIDENPANTGGDGNRMVETDKNEDGAGKKNYISILHFKAEYDDKTDKTNKDRIENSDFDFGNVPHVSGIKEYFNGIKQGIVNGFNSIIHKHKNNEENHTHDAGTGPFSFFNKIHRKTSNFAQKIHNHIFGEHEEGHF